MTILPNNKKSTGNGKGPSSNNNNNIQVENVHHNGPLSHPLSLPSAQNETLNLGSDRVFGANISPTSTIWSHSQNHSLSHGLNLSVSGEERPIQPIYEQLEAGSSHGKRRHRDSSLRCPRIKRRAERDRSNTSSPSAITTSTTSCSPSEAISTSGKVATPSSADVACNSEDEYDSRPQAQMTEEELNERERRFEKKIRKKGLIIKSMGEDGACLFRAVADQVYGDQDMHSVVRRHCMDYIAKNRDYFSQYVTEDFNHYVSRKRLDHVHGNHIEIQALSEMYNRTIEVFCYSTEPINTFHGTPQTDNAPIRLSYHRGIHYNSLVDPYKATVGVGLGLPEHIPGSADKNMLKEAAVQSEQLHIEQAMLEDKLLATDWEATSEVMEEQIARESYLQWLKDNERRNRVARSPTAPSSSTVSSSSTSEVRSPRPRSHGSPFCGDASYRSSPARLSPPPSVPSTSTCKDASNASSPKHGQSSPSYSNSSVTAAASNSSPEHAFRLLETSSFINQLPPEMFGMNEWEDAGILAQVLAASQQEYLDTLKKSQVEPGSLTEPKDPSDAHSLPSETRKSDV